MAHQMTVLYHHPDDAAAFDAYYESTHAPLAATLPGLRSYDVLRPLPNPGEDRPAYHLMASLTFDDEVAFGEAMTSERGRGRGQGPRELRQRRGHHRQRPGHLDRLNGRADSPGLGPVPPRLERLAAGPGRHDSRTPP